MDLTGKSVVSVDPGSRDLVTCVIHEDNGEEATWSFSNKERKNRMGVARAEVQEEPH